MWFLALAILITAVAVLAVAAPLWFAPSAGGDELDHDREFYRARLAEIDADLAQGRLNPTEAEAARAEEGRKLLAVSSRNSGKWQAGSTTARAAILAAILFVPLMAGAFYWSTGQPQMPDMAIAGRADRDLSQQSIEQLLQRAEARLAEEPEDLRGWLVVAPVYMRMGRIADAVNAYRNAVRLEPDDPQLKSSLAEAMVVGEQGVVKEQARVLFEEALAANPDMAKPRFYLAIALGQQGDWAEAVEAWRELISDAPPDAPWLATAQAQMVAAQQKIGMAAAPAQPQGEPRRGPDAADIEAAGQMSAEERMAMISGMVDSLAERLEENPGDKDGWRRLIRSYTVLGRAEKARAALEDARGHFEDDEAFLAELEDISRQLDSTRETQ